MRLGVVQQRADVVFLVTRCFGVFVVVIKTLDVGKSTYSSDEVNPLWPLGTPSDVCVQLYEPSLYSPGS